MRVKFKQIAHTISDKVVTVRQKNYSAVDKNIRGPKMVAPETKTFNKNLKEKFEDQIKRPGPASYKAIDHKSKNAPAVSFGKDYRRSELDKEFDMRPPI